MYKITVVERSAALSPSVPVAEVKDLDGAIAYGFQLHNMCNLPHIIEVWSNKEERVASFYRLEKVAFPDKVNK